MKKHNSLMKRALFLVVAISLHGIMFAQTKTITGVVKETTGDPVIGASVIVKGTTTGTVTNATGFYSLKVPVTAKTLVFTFVGMQKQELSITADVLNVTMNEDSKQLDELVVVGYGTVKRRDLTGSVSSVKSNEIMKTSSSNAMQAMQARVPGLDITQKSGESGGGLNINLRGNRSINAKNDPLKIGRAHV